MLKNILKMVFIALFAINLSANELKEKDGKFKINELILLPHIGKVLKNNVNELNVTSEQMQRVSKEVKQIYPPKFQELIRQAFPIEKRVQRKVMKGVIKEDLKTDLDEITRLKREAIDIKIDAINAFQKIFTKEQWKKIIKLSK